MFGRPRRLRHADDPGRPACTKAQAADGGGTDAACGRRRDGASRLAWTSIRAGRYVPSSGNLPGQPVAVERPRGGAGPAAELVRQFYLRRQPGPRRVFAAPDPRREHGVNVQPGPGSCPGSFMTSHTGSVNGSSPGGLHVLRLEHPCAAAPADGLRAGDDHARSGSCEGVRRAQGRHCAQG